MFEGKIKTLYLDAIADFLQKKSVYDKMYDYCVTGKTDAYREYKHNPQRSNLKVRTNFIKKFIKEEVNYLLGNKITYSSKSSNEEIINIIENLTSHWDKKQDKNIFRDMLVYGKIYELYYTTEKKIAGEDTQLVNAQIVTPREGFLLRDEYGQPTAFFRFFKKKFDKSMIWYIDIYTDEWIYHCDYGLNEVRKENELGEVKEPTPNTFGEIPVVEASISRYGEFDTLFNELKDLVDAYQTNLSDIVNEISDYRLAYLLFLGCQIDTVNKEDNGKTQLENLKEKGAISIDDPNADIKFLTKSINDTFVQNTLTTLKENIYEISGHINNNEKMQSNLSGSSIRNRLIGLEQVVSDNEDCMKNLILGRMYFILSFCNRLHSTKLDYRDISAKFTINIPQDDLLMAQTLSQLPDGLVSKQTGRKQLSFISNSKDEEEKVEEEQKKELESIPDIPHPNTVNADE